MWEPISPWLSKEGGVGGSTGQVYMKYRVSLSTLVYERPPTNSGSFLDPLCTVEKEGVYGIKTPSSVFGPHIINNSGRVYLCLYLFLLFVRGMIVKVNRHKRC